MGHNKKPVHITRWGSCLPRILRRDAHWRFRLKTLPIYMFIWLHLPPTFKSCRICNKIYQTGIMQHHSSESMLNLLLEGNENILIWLEDTLVPWNTLWRYLFWTSFDLQIHYSYFFDCESLCITWPHIDGMFNIGSTPCWNGIIWKYFVLTQWVQWKHIHMTRRGSRKMRILGKYP